MMNAFKPIRATAIITAMALFAGMTPTPVHAGGARVFIGSRGFVGGRGFLGGLAFGVGVGLGRSLFYQPPVYYSQPSYVVYPSPPPVYYVQQPVLQTVAVAAPAAPVAAPSAPAAASTAGKLSKILYDSSGKPIGVLVLNNDGTREFIPLAP